MGVAMFRTAAGAVLGCAVLVFAERGGSARAEDPAEAAPGRVSPAAFPPDVVPPLPSLPPPLALPPVAPKDVPPATPFATQTAGGGFQGRSFNEQFEGDFGGIFVRQKVQVGTTIKQVQVGTSSRQVQVGTTTKVITPPDSQPITVVTPVFRTVTTPIFRDVTTPVYREVQSLVTGRYSGVQITDNDSPRPVDRVYFGYSYYDGLGSGVNPGYGDVSQNRELFGFEKTVLDGDGSVGMRLPYLQSSAPFDAGRNVLGDLSLLFKYALYNNRDTGDVLSVGMVVTTPTGGGSVFFPDGSVVPHGVLLQPWFGGVKVLGRGYAQTINNIIIPTTASEVTLIGSSWAAGYRLNDGGGYVPRVTPTFETHLRVPLSNRDPAGLIFLQDQVNLTTGVHFNWGRLTVSGGTCVPVVGPRPWNIEALAYVNYRY
jgi:hypothetical protein